MNKGTKVFFNAENFDIIENESTGGFMVSGLALPFGKESRNGAEYNKESVIERHKTLENRPILYNHDSGILPMGHTVKIWCESNGMYYRGDVDPAEKDLIRKCKRGDISNVSIQAVVRPTNEGENGNVYIQEFLELSIVSIPGFGDANMIPEGFISMEKFIGEPFAGYKDFDDCVAKNQDKRDPDAYCASIKRKAEPEKMGVGKSIKEGDRINDEANNMDKDVKEAIAEVLKKLEGLDDRIKEQDEPAPMDVEAEINAIKSRLDEIEAQIKPSEEDDDDDDDEDKDKDKDKEEKIVGSKQSGIGSPGSVKEKLKRQDVLDMTTEVN